MGCKSSRVIERPQILWRGKVLHPKQNLIYNLSTNRHVSTATDVMYYRGFAFTGITKDRNLFNEENKVTVQNLDAGRIPPLFNLCGLVGKGKIINVVDGDTFDILFTIKGNGRWINKMNNSFLWRCRLFGINVYELGTPLGNIAKEFLASLILNKEVIYYFYHFDKYGRILCEIEYDNNSISKVMLEKNYAIPYMA